MASFLERNSKAINTASSALLAVICLLMYALLGVLYVSPAAFGIDSFVHPPAQPSPQVVVSICAALLAAATGALVTRCVEHSFWLKLSRPVARERRLAMAGVRDLAEWTVSPLRRFTYLFDGSDLPLRPAGVLLLAGHRTTVGHLRDHRQHHQHDTRPPHQHRPVRRLARRLQQPLQRWQLPRHPRYRRRHCCA